VVCPPVVVVAELWSGLDEAPVVVLDADPALFCSVLLCALWLADVDEEFWSVGLAGGF